MMFSQRLVLGLNLMLAACGTAPSMANLADLGDLKVASAQLSGCTEVSTLDIIASDNRPRKASLLQTDLNLTGIQLLTHASDPYWHIVDPQTGDHADFEWMDYLTNDGSHWGAKVHCEPTTVSEGKAGIHCWFEHRGADDHNDNNMRYLRAPDRKPMNAYLSILASYPASPTFCISPL